MTKSIRVINADSSDWKVNVITQCLDKEGNWYNSTTSTLDSPGSCTDQLYIYPGQRIVIEENGQTNYMQVDKSYIKKLEETVKKYAS